MSRHTKKMTAVLNAVFEAYNVDGSGKLVVVNEAASKVASEKLHELVLEKARELWDQLEAAEDSLASVAEEIRFEELNTDPSGTSGAVTHAAVAPEDAAAADAQAPADAEAATALESAESISDLLSADDLNLDEIFENLDHLDNHQNVSAPAGPDMPFDEMQGHMMDDEGDDVVDGDEDYDNLQIGMGDDGMGDDAASLDNGDGEFDAENGAEMDMGDPDNGDDMGMDDMDNGDDMGGFDFELDLEAPEDTDEMMGGYDEGMGHGDKSFRMEGKGDKPDFLDKDKDGDKKEPWKKAEKDAEDKDDDDDDDKDDDKD